MTTSLRSISIALIFALISVWTIAPAFSQNPTTTRTRPSQTSMATAGQRTPGQLAAIRLAPAQIRPDMIKVNKRPPVGFQPFQMIDPKTRKQVSADYLLTLPNGKQIKAGPYYSELNKFEQELNKIGYSLRTMPKSLTIQEIVASRAVQPTVATRKIAAARLSRPQLATRLRAVETAANGQRALTGEGLTPQAIDLLREKKPAGMGGAIVGAGRPVGPPHSPPVKVHREQPWGWTFPSESSKLQAYIRGKLITDATVYPLANVGSSVSDLYKSNTDFKMSANAEAGASIYGTSANLVQASATFYSPSNKAKPLNVNMGVSILGATVYSFNKNVGEKWSTGDTLSYDRKFEVPILGVSIAGKTLGVVIGAKFSTGFQYEVGMDRFGVYGNVNPFVHSAAYIEAGADLLIGGVAAEADLTLLNADLTLGGKAQVYWLFNWRVFDEFYCDYKLDMLSGKVYAYIYVNAPGCWEGPCPACIPTCIEEKKLGQIDFWSEKGFKDEGVIFDEKKIIPVPTW